MNVYKFLIFLVASFLGKAIDTFIAPGKSMAYFSQEINLEQSNFEVILTPQKKKRKTKFNLNNLYVNNSNSFSSVNYVSELKDVQLTAWSFQALQHLIKSYGCSVKFSSTIKHISRQEFAFNLNLCLNHISQLITSSRVNILKKNDIAIIKRLQKDFEAELAILGNDLNIVNIENDQTDLEQFSTTTKLNAEAIFIVTGSNNAKFKGNRDNLSRTDSDFNQPSFGFRTTLNFDTSFNGRDQLRTRLRGGKITPSFIDQTNMGGLETEIGFEREIQLTKLQYLTNKIPFIYDDPDDRLYFILSAFGTGLDEQFFETFNPYIIGSKDGFTQFSIYNPIFRQPRGVGASLGYVFSDRFRLAIGYSARGSLNEAATPIPGRGLFNGSFSTGINSEIKLAEHWMLGLTYLYSYSTRDRVLLFGQTGSERSSDPFNGNPTQAHNFGVQTTALINSKFNVAGWFGWTRALDASSDSDNKAEIINWALTFVVLDAFQEGNKAGLVVGMPPKLTSIKEGNSDPSNAWQVEAFYTHKVNDNIFLNPGFYVIVNPEHDSRNGTIFVGLLRTTFEF